MAITSKICRLTDPHMATELIGTISWDGKQLICDPPNNSYLQSIIQEPLLLGGKLIIPGDDPERWLRSLNRALSGTYVWATKVEEG